MTNFLFAISMTSFFYRVKYGVSSDITSVQAGALSSAGSRSGDKAGSATGDREGTGYYTPVPYTVADLSG